MRICSLLFLISFLFQRSSAQLKLSGYVIVGKDTINGKILVPITRHDELDFSEFGDQVSFENSSGNIKTYLPKKITGYGIHDSSFYDDYVSYNTNPKGMSKAYYFLRRVVPGKLQMFENFYMNASSAPMGIHDARMRSFEPDTMYFILINNFPEEIFMEKENIIRNIENLREYLQDYPELLPKIKKGLRWSELKEILITYNKTQSH